jgi:hypothetical protein
MVAAWEAFIAADAWGTFDGSDYAKALYVAGWPKDVRRYQARHSVALELGERGIDLGDVQGWLGHKQVTTTRKHYAPVLVSRLKQASESLSGRFGGWETDEHDTDTTDLASVPCGGWRPLTAREGSASNQDRSARFHFRFVACQSHLYVTSSPDVVRR